MNRVFSLVSVLACIIFLQGCGSKKSPTGGESDISKPELLSSLPAEFSSLSERKIELTFSKPLDKASVLKGLYIYPPVLNKKIKVEKNRVFITLNEDLIQDTNYFVTLNTRIKDIRGNALTANQSLVFASGTLQRNRVSGAISYEKQEDRSYPLQFTLLAADSLQVLSKELYGAMFAIDDLNSGEHSFRAFIDKNKNGYLDSDSEPQAAGSMIIKPFTDLSINLAYADTTKPLIRSVQSISNTELSIQFSEPVKSIGDVSVRSSNGNDLQVKQSYLDGTKLVVITEALQTGEHLLYIDSVTDMKANVSRLLRQSFYPVSRIDSSSPVVLSSLPRNGTSINQREPLIRIDFSELILPSSLDIKLIAAESSRELPVQIVQSEGSFITIKSRDRLANNSSYILTVNSCSDYAGNRLAEPFKLNFLILGAE